MSETDTPRTDNPETGYRSHYAEHEHNKELCRALERELAKEHRMHDVTIANLAAVEADLVRLAQSNAELTAEVERLERLVYVPGLWKCAKCSLTLVSTMFYVPSGGISANKEPQQCANGCGPMWRVTERDAGNDLVDRLCKAEEVARRALSGEGE